MKRRKLELTPAERVERERAKQLLDEIRQARDAPKGHTFKRRHAERWRAVRKGAY